MPDTANSWRNEPLGRILLRKLRDWWKSFESTDPWPAELDQQVREYDALPVCHRCFRPFEFYSATYFCEDCGAVVGPYNNCLPLMRYWSLGEVMRAGIGPHARLTYPFLTWYVFLSISASNILFPFYLFRLCRNIRRLKSVITDDSVDRRDANRRILFVAALTLALILPWFAILIPARYDRYEALSTPAYDLDGMRADSDEEEEILEAIEMRIEDRSKDKPQAPRKRYYSFEVDNQDSEPLPPPAGSVPPNTNSAVFTYGEL